MLLTALIIMSNSRSYILTVMLFNKTEQLWRNHDIIVRLVNIDMSPA